MSDTPYSSGRLNADRSMMPADLLPFPVRDCPLRTPPPTPLPSSWLLFPPRLLTKLPLDVDRIGLHSSRPCVDRRPMTAAALLCIPLVIVGGIHARFPALLLTPLTPPFFISVLLLDTSTPYFVRVSIFAVAIICGNELLCPNPFKDALSLATRVACKWSSALRVDSCFRILPALLFR